MPYQIKEEDDKFCVYNLDNKKKEGDYKTRADAMKRMKALYANEKGNQGKPAEAPAADDSGKDDK